MEKALIVNLICNMFENIAMVAGIVYASVYFNRFSLLWFLLLPLLNSKSVRLGSNSEDDEQRK